MIHRSVSVGYIIARKLMHVTEWRVFIFSKRMCVFSQTQSDSHRRKFGHRIIYFVYFRCILSYHGLEATRYLSATYK